MRRTPCTRGNSGRGNQDAARQNATLLQPAVPTVRSAADLLVRSARTVRRWWLQIRRTGSPNRRAHAGGRKYKLSKRWAWLLFWAVMVDSSASFVELRDLLKAMLREDLEQWLPWAAAVLVLRPL